VGALGNWQPQPPPSAFPLLQFPHLENGNNIFALGPLENLNKKVLKRALQNKGPDIDAQFPLHKEQGDSTSLSSHPSTGSAVSMAIFKSSINTIQPLILHPSL
jgi:hypothetical protein